jgi:CRP-like cAMP-binding protein
MGLTTSERAVLLGGVGLFAVLNPEDRAAFADAAIEVSFPEGRRIARQGEVETGFFLVLAGSATVTRNGRPVATIEPGGFFGELSLLDGSPRTATVTADAATTCLALPTWEFQRLIRERPGFALPILKEAARRIRALSSEGD